MTTTATHRAILAQALADAQHAARGLAWLRAQTPETALARWADLFEQGRYRAAREWWDAVVWPRVSDDNT